MHFYVWYVLNKIFLKYCSLYIPGAHFSKHFQLVGKFLKIITGHEILPNTGTNTTKFFTLATKSWKLVTKLATDKSAANFLVKFVSKMQHMHLNRKLDAILDLGELEHCISYILVFPL